MEPRPLPEAMPLLPDLAVAAGYGLVVFLLTLGVLVVFVEALPRRIVVAVIMIAFLLAAFTALVGEAGVGIVSLAFAAAFIANGIFEWLTTR